MAYDAATGTSHDCDVISTAASTAGTSTAAGAATMPLDTDAVSYTHLTLPTTERV